MTKEDNLPKIQIQNLYINLNAEVVQQLNINPKEVRNYFGEQIMEAITTAIRKDKNDKSDNKQRLSHWHTLYILFAYLRHTLRIP